VPKRADQAADQARKPIRNRLKTLTMSKNKNRTKMPEPRRLGKRFLATTAFRPTPPVNAS
jgi:hypothetical protein